MISYRRSAAMKEPERITLKLLLQAINTLTINPPSSCSPCEISPRQKPLIYRLLINSSCLFNHLLPSSSCKLERVMVGISAGNAHISGRFYLLPWLRGKDEDTGFNCTGYRLSPW